MEHKTAHSSLAENDRLQSARAIEQSQPIFAVPSKDKTIAVLLAVFLGFWTWVYTYRKDSTKFWVNAGITGGLFLLILPTFGFIVFLIPFWGFASWLWAVIDVATKPTEYYWKFYTKP